MVRPMGTAAYGGKGRGKGKGRGEGRLGQGGRGRSKGGEKLMGTTAYGGKGSKGRAANGDRPVGAASCRRDHHTMASCQNPPHMLVARVRSPLPQSMRPPAHHTTAASQRQIYRLVSGQVAGMACWPMRLHADLVDIRPRQSPDEWLRFRDAFVAGRSSALMWSSDGLRSFL